MDTSKNTLRGRSAIALFVTLLLLTVTSALRAAPWALSGNLIIHDPSITRDGSGPYWTFATGDGIGTKRSSDGRAGWAEMGPVFPSALSWWRTYVPNHSGTSVWAPDVRNWNGTWWLYYSISTFGSNTSAIGLASKTGSLSNSGWTDRGMVIRSTSSNNYNAIDPNLVIDANNQPWLVFGSFWDGIFITRLDASTMKPTGSLTNIARRGGGIEAPHIVYRSPYYYLFVSFDSCCNGVNSTYKIAYGRSSSITGPYVDQNGNNMLSGGGTILDSGDSRWRGPGGQSVFGTSVLARHAYDAQNNGAPTLLINDLYWPNNWPSYTNSTGGGGGGFPAAGTYKLRNRSSGLMLDNSGSTADGANISQRTSSSSNNQRWVLSYVSSNVVKLQCVTGGKYLDGMGRTTDGSIVGQWANSASNNQRWTIIDAGGGYFKLRNVATNKCVDVGASPWASGDVVEQWFDNSSQNQQWQFVAP